MSDASAAGRMPRGIRSQALTGPRILGGRFRGRAVSAPVAAGTRPLLSRIRKSLVDTLAPRLAGAGVLDLFAGTGVVGLEMLSRGATAATFVESSAATARGIAATGAAWGLTGAEIRAVEADALRPGGWLRPDLPGRPWRVVFVGTPFRLLAGGGAARLWRALDQVADAGALEAAARLVIQYEEGAPLAAAPGWTVAPPGPRRYGRTALAHFTRGAQPA